MIGDQHLDARVKALVEKRCLLSKKMPIISAMPNA